MSLDTVSGLRNSIADYLDDDTLSDQIDDFIALAEARHRREIRMREMITRDALTVDSRFVSLPNGFLEAMNIRLLTDPVTVLQEVPVYEMTVTREETNGKPSFFAIASDIEFDRSPDQSYSGQITYYKALTALSDANTSNTLLSLYPDAYLYAALSASAPYQMADERLRVWEALYRDAVQRINAQANASRRVGPLISRVHGRTP